MIDPGLIVTILSPLFTIPTGLLIADGRLCVLGKHRWNSWSSSCDIDYLTLEIKPLTLVRECTSCGRWQNVDPHSRTWRKFWTGRRDEMNERLPDWMWERAVHMLEQGYEIDIASGNPIKPSVIFPLDARIRVAFED